STVAGLLLTAPRGPQYSCWREQHASSFLMPGALSRRSAAVFRLFQRQATKIVQAQPLACPSPKPRPGKLWLTGPPHGENNPDKRARESTSTTARRTSDTFGRIVGH